MALFIILVDSRRALALLFPFRKVLDRRLGDGKAKRLGRNRKRELFGGVHLPGGYRHIFCPFIHVYAKNEKNIDVRVGEYAIIPTRYGKDMAKVLGISKKPMGVKPSDVVVIERKASKEDLSKAAEYEKKEKEAYGIFKEKVQLHKLDMKLITVHFLIDEQKALFFFSSENRVDFRELVKDLAAKFHTRIELRQVGVRDKAKEIGGYGSCGRPLCCSKFLCDFDSVSINMAKNQNIALNPTKINGACGRLLCCLKYEDECYKEYRR